MKRIIFATAALLTITQGALAQDIERSETRVTVNRIRFGAYVAPNISWMKPNAKKSDNGEFSVASDGSKLGFTYGLMAEYYFARNYGIVTGLQVNSTGGKMISTNVDQTITNAPRKVLNANFDYRLQYLEIPIALKLRTDDINGFKFFGQLGVTLGINVGKKATYTVDYVSAADTTRRSVSDDKIKLTALGTLKSPVAPIMLAMNIGAGAEYPINRKLTAYFGVFFNNGFTPDATSPQNFDNQNLGYEGTFYDAKVRLNNFSVRLGLFF